MDVETILQAFALGLDAILLGLLHKSYLTSNTYANALKEAEQLDIDHLKKLSQPKTGQSSRFWTFWKKTKSEEAGTQNRCYYACVRGKAEPVEKSTVLKSNDCQSSGVIHKILTTEVSAVWTGGRFWVNEERVMKQLNRETPWILKSQTPGSKSSIHVIDGLHADLLDIATVKDEFTPSPFSISTWIGGWLAGQQVKGIHELEEMLETGSLVTVVGEIVVNKNGTMQLRSSGNTDFPFIISQMTHADLLNNYETVAAGCKWGCLILGGIGLYLLFSLARKWLRPRTPPAALRNEYEILNDLRNARTSSEVDSDVPDWQRCVVCLTRAREVIVLPCGHVCLCADCMLLINEHDNERRMCPMCRAPIEQIARAFVP